MATIGSDDQNRDPNKPVVVNTANANIQPPSGSSGTQTPRGNFSTLQKYLGANAGAGSRVAGLLGKNIQNEATQQEQTTGRELGEAEQANQAFGGLKQQTEQFTQQLNQPSAQENVTPTANAYDVSNYKTNLSGQQAAQDIAQNQEKLGQFRGLASGDTAAKTRAESQKQAQEAINATQKASDINKQRQQQLQFEPQRQQLLSDVLNTGRERAGVRALDAAFLSQDKNRTLNAIANNLRQAQGGLQSNVTQAGQKQSNISGIGEQQVAAEQALNQRLGAMQSEYDKALQDRVSNVNAAKIARQAELENQFNRLRDTGEATQSFADLLELNKLNQLNSPGGTRLFNTLQDQQLNNFLNTDLLKQQAITGRDVANQADISALKNLASLRGVTPENIQASQFVGEQTGGSSLDEALNQRINQFNTEDLLKQFSGQGSNRQFFPGTSDQVIAGAQAQATLNDIINQGIIGRRAGFTMNTPPGYGFTPVPTGVDEIALANYLNSRPYDQNASDQLGQYSNNPIINDIINQAQQQAVGQVQSGAQNYLGDIGYNNLLKIIQG